MKEMVTNSLKYSSSNWFRVIMLGMVIFLADLSNELSVLGSIAQEIRYVIIVLGIILGVYQVGFIFRIIEETTHGSDIMPKFDKFWSTFYHGIKELLVTVIYFIIPFIMVLIGIALLDDLTGPKNPEIDIIFVFFGLFLASLTYLLYQAAVLNMANHHGTIKSGFDLKRIYKKLRDIGLKKSFFIYILTVVFAVSVEVALADTRIILPIIGDLLSTFIIAPFILIFIARTLGLINKSLER